MRKTIQEVTFHGLASDDAIRIATAWDQFGLLHSSPAGTVARDDVAVRLAQSSNAMFEGEGSTLFGAILDVRYGNKLEDRIRDLVEKLNQIKVRQDRDTTLADVLKAICLIQHLYDDQGRIARGASRSLIAATVGLESVFADGKILELLGKEAAVAYIGDRVYSRHPAIARTVVDQMRKDGSIMRVVHIVARAGAKLRNIGDLPGDHYRDAYLIARDLDRAEEAVAAAEGALEGAPSLLEPRVTYIMVLRKNRPDRATRYIAGITPHITEFQDFPSAVRAFFVEYSLVASNEGAPQLAIGAAFIALCDGLGPLPLDSARARYALVRLVRAAVVLKRQNRAAAEGLSEASSVALERLVGNSTAAEYIGADRAALENLDRFRRFDTAQLCSLVRSRSVQFAASVAQKFAFIKPEALAVNRLHDLLFARQRRAS